MGTWSGGGGSRTDLKRWMLFVDGENFTCRAQALAQDKGIQLVEGDHYSRDVFVWFPNFAGSSSALFRQSRHPLHWTPIRSYYYTSVRGSDETLEGVRMQLWTLGFQAEVFKRNKERDSKGVDIALTKDMLTHAFFDHY